MGCAGALGRWLGCWGGMLGVLLHALGLWLLDCIE